ncbi:hypothetical protein [Rhizobium binxianense]|uniref:hypothetical protein n=1 Tax=Rhizobium binxianense TaxID=3024242 RepID=UPI00235E17DB|nr:hypothetical protein [Rhizobium sp. MC62]MDC9809232.1 hypothetical protein [Rhizobium sp. MC62]
MSDKSIVVPSMKRQEHLWSLKRSCRCRWADGVHFTPISQQHHSYFDTVWRRPGVPGGGPAPSNGGPSDRHLPGLLDRLKRDGDDHLSHAHYLFLRNRTLGPRLRVIAPDFVTGRPADPIALVLTMLAAA